MVYLLDWGGGGFLKALMLHVVPYSTLALLLGVALLVLAPLAASDARQTGAKVAWSWGLLSVVAGLCVLGMVLLQFRLPGAPFSNPGLLTLAYAAIALFVAWGMTRCFPQGLNGAVAVLAVAGAWFLAIAMWAISQP